MLHYSPALRRGRTRLWMSCLLPVAGVLASQPAPAAEKPIQPSPAPAPARKVRPRDRFAAGERWRVRTSQLPIQQPEPDWTLPETWDFAVLGVQSTPDGPRLVITATREGATKPTVWLQLDPQTQAVLRADSLIPAAGGERYFTERPAPGEPFVSQASPVPIVLPTPTGSGKTASHSADTATQSQPTTDKNDAARATGSQPVTEKEDTAQGADSSPAADSHPSFSFSFGPRFHQMTEPLDAGAGRDMIERGMAPMKLRREARLEPAGIPRFLTQIEGPGAHIKQVWDDTTPWPLYSETETSRTWLVTYQKEK